MFGELKGVGYINEFKSVRLKSEAHLEPNRA